MRVVVVEPESLLRKVLGFVLTESGHEVTLARTGLEALRVISAWEADAVIVDTELPDTEGATLCQKLRACRHIGPIVILSPVSETKSKLRLFEHGADDYIVTPCDPAEVAARVEVAARRYRQSDLRALGSTVKVDDVELSLGQLTVRVRNQPPQRLTPTELRMLEILMRNSPMAIARETLVERVWGSDSTGESNRVDVYVMRLRRKLERDPARPRYLLTVRGIGYTFRPPIPELERLPDWDSCIAG